MNLLDLQKTLFSFSSTTRLYSLQFKEHTRFPSENLLVEAFLAVEALQSIDARDVIMLSNDGELPLDKLLGQQASLNISMANGSRTSFTGLISEAAMLGSTGSLVRYRLRLSSLL